jgi:DNA-binding response OmpR family regulator
LVPFGRHEERPGTPVSRVLLVEDDVEIAQLVAMAIEDDGHEVVIAGNGAAALERARRGDVDLVLLDLGLPDLDGLEVCRRIRSAGSAVPILVLTGRADEIDTVVGLDAGADDYVAKPFRLAELLARVRAMLRRGADAAPTEVNGVRVDEGARRAWLGDVELDLTPKEFDLLALLLREAGSVVTRERILQEVWGAHWFGTTKTLDMHVSWLRRKLGDDPAHPRFISTLRGIGFRFETMPE